MNKNFTVLQYLKLADILAKMRMKSQANMMVLSYIWLVLEPLIMVSLFYFLFSHILKRGGDDYFTFMIIGKTVFLWFSKSVTTSSRSLLSNKGILSQRAIPKWVFPISSIYEVTYKSLVTLFLLIAVCLINGFYPSVHWIQLSVLIFVLFLVITGVSLISSILVSIAQDFSNLINMGMLGLMFASGIFWDINTIESETIREIFLILNPLALIIHLFREVIMFNHWLDYNMLIAPIVISLSLISLSLGVFKKWNNQLTRLIFS